MLIYFPDINSRQELNDFAVRLTDSRDGDGFYNTAPSISPKGDKVVFISNRDNFFSVYIADVKTKKILKKLISGNQSANFEELHLLAPGLCWSPNGRKIAISVKSGSKDAIYIIDVESGDENELPIEFDGIFSVDWNPNNNSLVFRGDNARQCASAAATTRQSRTARTLSSRRQAGNSGGVVAIGCPASSRTACRHFETRAIGRSQGTGDQDRGLHSDRQAVA